MALAKLFFWLLFPLALFAQTEGVVCKDCEKKTASAASTTSKATEKCESSESADALRSRTDKLIGSALTDTLGLVSNPTRVDASSITYRLGSKRLGPGQTLFLAVPEHLSTRRVQFVILKHRQNPAEQKGSAEGWDDVPGLTSVQIYDLNPQSSNDPWRFWGGQASGEKGAKFAEISNSFEIENLYEWRHHGHSGAMGGEHSTQPLLPGAIRIQSVGKDPVEVEEITLKVAAPQADYYSEVIYSEGTDFGNPHTEEGRRYGGGQAHQGKFPGAVVLGSGSPGTTVAGTSTGGSLPAEKAPLLNFENVGGRIEVALPAGYQITSVEVAAGDSHPDGVRNKDGGWGTKGWGRLNMSLLSGGAQTSLMSGENVPPEGVMMSTLQNCSQVTKSADRLIISGSSDRVYVMGVRIGLRKK